MFGISYKPNNLTESLLPILILNWIFGHQIMRYTMDSYRFIQTFFYSILVLIIYGASLGYSIIFFVTSQWFHHSEKVYFVVISTNVLIMVVNFILGWIHRNKALFINIKSLNVDKKLAKIGAISDKKKALNFSINVAAYWIICSLTLNLIAMSWNIEIFNWRDNAIFISSIQHPIHVNFLVELLFCVLIRNMEMRFKKINEELLKLELFQHNLPITNVRIDENRPIYILHLLKESHLELSVLCDKLTQIFGLQIIMSMASLFVLITTMSYNLYLHVTALQVEDKVLRMCVITFWIIIHVSKLMFINHICSRTVNEWKKTGIIIHQLESKFLKSEICKTIQQFSVQMIQNPLHILPLGFLKLGHSFMQGFFGTIATYLIILIQMAPLPKQISPS